MAMVYVNDDDMTNIAAALRSKLKTDELFKPSQMAVVLQSLDVIKNDLPSLLNRSLTSFVEDSSITKVKTYGFAYCLMIHTVSLGSCITLEDHAFYGCRNIKTISLPKVTTVGESALSGCERIVSLTLPKVTSIGHYAMNNCVRLEELILSNTSVCTLADADALVGTLIAEGNGKIKVPSNLVNSYKNASGWSTYASKIVAI